ncbi:hypothetical protein JQC92_18640 [Shewanella sp. 202IG2-18]|uniref:hypothetical protein n=1 Tax=Parashewanella hymeniacidonis TaxID=2807618 RepID=UPI00195F4399|nr:hypothetical protein [Parashewanella hymeniacidonis]MBM7074026.1 hypothetical protein [Parashewanella hymeniacidonis]
MIPRSELQTEIQQFIDECIGIQKINYTEPEKLGLSKDEQIYHAHMRNGFIRYKLTVKDGNVIKSEWFCKPYMLKHLYFGKTYEPSQQHDREAQAFYYALTNKGIPFWPTPPYGEACKTQTVDDWKTAISAPVTSLNNKKTLLLDIQAFTKFDEPSFRIASREELKSRVYFVDSTVVEQLRMLKKNGHDFILLNNNDLPFSTVNELLSSYDLEITPKNYLNKLSHRYFVTPQLREQIDWSEVPQAGMNKFARQFCLNGDYLYITTHSSASESFGEYFLLAKDDSPLTFITSEPPQSSRETTSQLADK